MRYGVTLEHGGWVVWDTISRETVTRPASEEAQEAVKEWNARCVTRQVDPPIKVDGWTPAGELTFWLQAEGSWWGLVQGKDGVRWIRAEDLRPG
jgi:phage baseplate assembly protein W